MVNKSPWTVLQSIKSQLRNTEFEQTKIITCLCGGDEINLAGYPIIGASGQYYNFRHMQGTSEYDVDLTTYDAEHDTWNVTSTYNFDSLDELLDYSDNKISMSSVLLDIQQGISSNKLIADICNSFQASQNLSLSDVLSLINNSDLDVSEKHRIGSYVQSAMNNSTITSYGWMSIMQRIFKEGYDTADSGTTIMDKSKPFVLQSLASTIINSITTVLSAVAFGLKSAYGALLMLVAQLVSSVFSYITKIASNTVNTDLNSTTFYVKGPSKYCESFTGASMPYVNNAILHESFGPYDIYSWISDPDADDYIGKKIDVNAFINVGFDVVKAIKKLHDENWYTIYRDGQYNSWLKFQWNPDGNHYNWGSKIKEVLYRDQTLYMSQEECMAIMSDESKCTTYLHLLLYFDNMLNFRTSDATPYRVGDVLTYIFDNDQDILNAGKDVPCEDNSSHKGDMVKSWCGLFGRILLTGLDITLDNFFNNTISTAFIQDWYNQFGTDQAENPLDYNTHTYGFISYTMREKDGLTTFSDTNYIAVEDTLYGWTPKTSEDAFLEYVESIPTDRGITVPDMTWDKLALVISILAVAVATAFVAKKVATKILNKRFTAKRLADVRRLNEARELYNAYPNDQNAYNNYYKEVRRYNLKANLLGWNTYDPINNWFNEPSNGSAFVGSIKDSQPTLLEKAQAASTSLNNITGTQLPDMQSGQTNSIAEVLQTIRGY